MGNKKIGTPLRRRKLIAVIGGRHVEKALLKEAADVGRLIANRGPMLICGGLDGVMEAASKGARFEGGLTIGILHYENKKEANEYIDVPQGYVKVIVN